MTSLKRTKVCVKVAILSIAAAMLLTTALTAAAANLAPVRSFPIPVLPDPDINVNGLAYGGGNLFALNTFYDAGSNQDRATIYALDPANGTIMRSFPSPFGGGLASDGASLYVNTFAPVEGAIVKLAATNGSVIQTIQPTGVIITGGAGGLAFLDGDLFQVAATADCGGVSIIRRHAADGGYLGCFNIDALGITPRELDANGTDLLYGTWVKDDQTTPPTFRWTVYTLIPTGAVANIDTIFSVQADSEEQATLSFDVNGIACGDNQLFVAERRNQEVLVYPFSCPSAAELKIDIKPSSYPNAINPRNHGVIPVAVLTTNGFDAASLDLKTVRFGRTGTEAAPVHYALTDVNGDGKKDLMLQFRTQATGILCGDTAAVLTGKTFTGETVQGSDSVRTVGCPMKGKKNAK